MFKKLPIWLLLSLLFSALLSSCTASSADCNQDTDCPAGQYCAPGGGVFFEGGICLNKNQNPDQQPPDVSSDAHEFNDSNTAADTTASSDALSGEQDSDAQTENTDVQQPDADEADTAQPLECVSNNQCEQPDQTSWNACLFELPCDTKGIQKREVRTATCENNRCVTATTTEEQECTRDTTNEACGQSTSGDWSQCSFDGKKTRQTYSPQCRDSVCSTTVGSEEVSCTCTSNASCGAITYGNWGSCTFENTCATTGTQTREVRTPACANGACSIIISEAHQTCTRNSTEGQSCGTVTFSQWSTCSYSNTCSNSGTSSRIKNTPTCQNGTCGSTQTTEGTECGSRNTNDTVCGERKKVTSGVCTYADICENFGLGTPDKYITPVCLSGTCSGEKAEFSAAKCNRNTNGTPCGSFKDEKFCNLGCCGICK